MSRLGLLFLCTNAALGVAATRVETRCGGSEGPKPFQDVSSKILAGTEMIKTSGGLRDWLFWEGQNSIVRATLSGDLIQTQLPAQQERVLGTSPLALSRIVDDENRYLVTDKETWVFDRLTASWSHFALAARPLQHLFWNAGALYTLHETTTPDEHDLDIYRYQPGSLSADPICSFRAKGFELKLAEGHQFPFLFFYTTSGAAATPKLTVYKLDVRDCSLPLKYEFKEPLDGPVLDVFRFEDQNSMAIRIDHPTKNILFENPPNSCRYFSLKGATPFVGNFKLPILFTWSKDDGIGVFDLKSESMGRLLKGIPFAPLTKSDVWLASNGQRLFLSPAVEGESSRSLLELKLSSFRR